MENINLDNLTIEQLATLKHKVDAAWNSRYSEAINEVNTVKLTNGDVRYTYEEKTYLATKLPNGKIRLFHAEDASSSYTKRTGSRYKRGKIANSEIHEGFYGIRHLIRFNQITTA